MEHGSNWTVALLILPLCFEDLLFFSSKAILCNWIALRSTSYIHVKTTLFSRSQIAIRKHMNLNRVRSQTDGLNSNSRRWVYWEINFLWGAICCLILLIEFQYQPEPNFRSLQYFYFSVRKSQGNWTYRVNLKTISTYDVCQIIICSAVDSC